METTRTKMTRARSFTAEGLAAMLTARNFTLQYGEPLVYSSTLYGNDTYTGHNHFFIGGDFSNSANSYSPNNFHVGPYYGGTGVSVDNNPGSANLGEIGLNLLAGSNVTIAAENGAYRISAATGNGGVMATTYDRTNQSLSATIPDIDAAYSSGKMVLCKNGNKVYYLSLFENSQITGINAEFTNTSSQDGVIDKIVYDSATQMWNEISVNPINHTDKIKISSGVSTYNVMVRGTVHRVVVDNTNNSTAVTIGVDQSTSIEYMSTQENLFDVNAGEIKMFTFTQLADSKYTVDAVSMQTY